MLRPYEDLFKKMRQADGDYPINHSAVDQLMDQDGAFVTTIDYREDRDSALKTREHLVA